MKNWYKNLTAAKALFVIFLANIPVLLLGGKLSDTSSNPEMVGLVTFVAMIGLTYFLYRLKNKD